MFNVRAV